MAVLLCSKKCKPAWRNDLAINIKLTAATYGGFHTYFKYQTENYDTVISALAESWGLQVEWVKSAGVMSPATKSRL